MGFNKVEGKIIFIQPLGQSSLIKKKQLLRFYNDSIFSKIFGEKIFQNGFIIILNICIITNWYIYGFLLKNW